MKIIFTGGGTIGSVSPLLAIKDKIEESGKATEFLWVGTKDGIEKEIVGKEKMPYLYILSAKLRRYFSWQIFIDPIRFVIGFLQSLLIIKTFKPDYIISAGGFVAVPMVWAGWCLRRVCVIHQQDIRPGLANKMMAPFARRITVAFEPSLKLFPAKKTVLVGNPSRSRLFKGTKDGAISRFNLEPGLPVLVVLGGSLGAQKINELMFKSITRLIDFCQIIHSCGRGNAIDWQDKENFGQKASRYHSFEYLYDDLPDAYAAADLVVCRAGLSTLTEVSALGKAAVVIPIPEHQQEDNAQYFAGKNAIIQLEQEKTAPEEFVDLVKNLLDNPNSRERLGANVKSLMPEDAAARFVKSVIV